MVVRMIVGLVLTAVALALAGRRLWWLWLLAMSGQPAPERVAAVREHPGRDVETQAAEVIGQRKLLKWSVPGVAHALTFWGFIVLLLTIIEAYGALFARTFASRVVGHWLPPLGYGTNAVLEAPFILAQLGVILAFLVIVVYSKHLHIATAPLNVLFSRRPNALGALEPMRSNGKVLDFEEADPDTDVFGLGKIEDFTWKGLLDMATCTECGRGQSQCPAWATGKPLSPKQVILDLRDHAFAKAPWILASSDEERDKLPDAVKAEAERPLDGTIGDDVEYLFWVGCAGALEDRAKKTTKAIATLLHQAGVTFAVLGPGETCTGDPARRIGNEFVFSMLAQQNIETLNEVKARK